MSSASILKRLLQPKVETYAFPDAAELQVGHPPPEEEELPDGGAPEEPEEPETPPPPQPETPIDFALLEADLLLQDARVQAQKIVEQAKEDARREAEEIYEQARLEGSKAGYSEGMARAAQEAEKQQEAQAAQLGAEVQQFLDRASASMDELMDRNADDLRDLALAIAEKVVRISLRSSSEVVGRMIRSAIDKRKRKEWVHIYIADCDAKRMTQVPPSLSAALSALSSRVRIIPMADDESGTCIVEMPDEIIDASASTQLSNIRNLLMDTPPGDDQIDLRFSR